MLLRFETTASGGCFRFPIWWFVSRVPQSGRKSRPNFAVFTPSRVKFREGGRNLS